MRELDDATVERQLRRVLNERLGALPLELTAESIERRSTVRQQSRRRRQTILGLGLAGGFLPAAGLAAGGFLFRTPAPAVVIVTPIPSPVVRQRNPVAKALGAGDAPRSSRR